MPSLSFNIEPLSARDVIAACQLELEAGLRTSGEAQMLVRLLNPQELLLVAVQSLPSATPHLLGLFSGWIVMDEMEVDNLVVEGWARQQGIGQALLIEALRLAWQRGARRAFLEVRSSNAAALNLYNRLGFKLVGKRRNYYTDPLEDAQVLQLELVKVAAKLNLRQS